MPSNISKNKIKNTYTTINHYTKGTKYEKPYITLYYKLIRYPSTADKKHIYI